VLHQRCPGQTTVEKLTAGIFFSFGIGSLCSLNNSESCEFQTNFVRHDTPHPKELRTRHSKLMKKDVDGHIIPRNPDREKGVRGKCY
jgi:hypothetical protein